MRQVLLVMLLLIGAWGLFWLLKTGALVTLLILAGLIIVGLSEGSREP